MPTAEVVARLSQRASDKAKSAESSNESSSDAEPEAHAAGGMTSGVWDLSLCPITKVPMREPVIAEDGHTYDREAIEKWLSLKGVSPP